MFNFSKKEVVALIISVLVLAFVFGFDDGAPTFQASYWLTNFITIAIFVAISLIFREIVVKYFARRHDAEAEYKVWQMQYLWFDKKVRLVKPLPVGIILSLILVIFSKGVILFTAIGQHDLIVDKKARVGRKFQNLQYFEEAQIVAAGILSSLFLAILILMVGNISGNDFSKFVNINFFIAAFNLIPFSNLDGAKILFGSIPFYIFIAILTIVAFVLIHLNVVLGLLGAFLLALVISGLYFLSDAGLLNF